MGPFGWRRLARVVSTGPADAWLLPRLRMSFRPVPSPINDHQAKLGGQPVWLDEPFWPQSAILGSPMTFIGQFPIPGPAQAMAYLFLTDEDGTLGTWDPEGGETALIVQPGGRVAGFLAGTPAATGPSLWRRGPQWTDRVPVELSVELSVLNDAERMALEADIAYQDAVRAETFADLPIPDHDVLTPTSYVGGRPHFWQPQIQVSRSWLFFFQLDGCEDWEDDEPYALNFGGGTGYAFLSQDELEGRFYWDCI
jgi:hypothetical protein